MIKMEPKMNYLAIALIVGIIIVTGLRFYTNSETDENPGVIEKVVALPESNRPIPQEVNLTAEGTKIMTARIDDMSCGGCLYSIRSALSKVDGVKKYDVYLGRPGKAVVEYDLKIITPEEIAAVITNLGYPATAIGNEEGQKIQGTRSAGSCGSGGCGCGCRG